MPKKLKMIPSVSVGIVSDAEKRNNLPTIRIMDLRHQSSTMCIIMLGEKDTHPLSATKVGNPIPVTIPVDRYQQNNQQTTHTSHYTRGPVETNCFKN